MKKIQHTQRIKDLEIAYWNAHHYMQVCAADPSATLKDRRECLDDVKSAYESLARAIWTQHRKQHGTAASMAEIKAALKEWITDNLNARHTSAVDALSDTDVRRLEWGL